MSEVDPQCLEKVWLRRVGGVHRNVRTYGTVVLLFGLLLLLLLLLLFDTRRNHPSQNMLNERRLWDFFKTLRMNIRHAASRKIPEPYTSASDTATLFIRGVSSIQFLWIQLVAGRRC